ncbi:MAG: hypothetical protein QMD36_06670, partial [Candidatus Aenigmarchaeota archaeon]|nr:hypothetical protein [Candidatus Aenigmarchaeota archaeon]
RCWDDVTINVTVPISRTWSRIPTEMSKIVYDDTSGIVEDILINNTGNVNQSWQVTQAGNATDAGLIIISDTSPSTTKQTTVNITINYSIPVNQDPGIYVSNISITNSTADPQQLNITVTLDVKDNILPLIDNVSIIPGFLDVNYEILTIQADVTDNVEVNTVWALMVWPNSTEENFTMNLAGGNTYQTTFVPKIVGVHNITIYANDTTSNVNNTILYQREAIGNTTVAVSSNVTTITLTITQYTTNSTSFNITLNNTGQGGARWTNVTWELPQGGSENNGWNAWQASPSLLDYGNITEAAWKSNSSEITVSSCTPPAIYIVNATANWTNPDNSVGGNETSINVTITSKRILNTTESSLSANVSMNVNTTVGNLTVNSTGNDWLENVTLECVSGEVCSGIYFYSLTYIPNNFNLIGCDYQSVEIKARPKITSDPALRTGTIRINASNSVCDPASDCWKEITIEINVTNEPTVLENASVKSPAGWGETLTYSVDVDDPNSDRVNVSLWVNSSTGWTKYEEKTLPSGSGTLTWDITPFSCSDIGERQYKFEYVDIRPDNNALRRARQNTTVYSQTIERDDIVLEHLSGNASTVYRAGENEILGIRLRDTDRTPNVYVSGENISFWVYYAGSWNEVNLTSTNADGNATYDWHPNCSVEVGLHDWKANHSISSCYKANESVFTLTVKDVLTINIDSPVTNQILHKTVTEQLNSTVNDSCQSPPTQSYSVTWYNESWDQIATSDNTTWQVPVDYTLGSEIIRANATGSYYDTGTDQVSVLIYGYSNVTNLTYNTTTYPLQGSLVKFTCKVMDVNTSNGIENYPVLFWRNDTLKSTSLTNSSGIATWVWNTSGETVGDHLIKCNITHNSTVYYNATEPTQQQVTIRVAKKPDINWIETYLSPTYLETDSFFAGENIITRVNVTDEEGKDDISWVKINITDPLGSVAVDSESMIKVATTPNGYIYEYNYSTGALYPRGTWNITIQACDSHGYKKINESYFILFARPELSGLVNPTSAGWGETFTYEFKFKDVDNETVNVTLWESPDNTTWDYVYSVNYNYTDEFSTIRFEINSTACKNTKISGNAILSEEGSCIPHTCSDINSTYWKVTAYDYHPRGNTTAYGPGTFNIEKNDVTIYYVTGNQSSVNRPEGNTTLKLKIKDTDRNVFIGEANVSAKIWVTTDGSTWDSGNWANTTQDGNITLEFDPDCSYSAGVQKWKGGTWGDSCYKNANSTVYLELTAEGQLKNYLQKPDQDYNVTNQVPIRFNVTDECSVVQTEVTGSVELSLTGSGWEECTPVLEEGSGWYNCTWDSTGKQEGNWNIRINTSKTYYNDNSTTWANRFFLDNLPPSGANLIATPDPGGWGEEFTYNVSVSDPENDTVTCRLWINTTGSWVSKGTQVSQAPYTCSIQVSDYTSSEIGSYQYKFELNDTYEFINTSVEVGEIERDDVSVIYISGNETQVNRNGTASVTFQIRINDTDRSEWVGAGVNTSLWVTTDGSTYYKDKQDQLTDSLGYSNITFDPSSSIYNVGKQLWIIGTDGDECYKDANSSAYNVTIIGDIAIALQEPSGQTYRAGTDSITFRWNLTDDNSTVVDDASNKVEIKLNTSSTWQDITSSCPVQNESQGWYNCTWSVPWDQQYGWYDVRINASKQYYNDKSTSFDERFEINTTQPSLSAPWYSYEQDAGWGEWWFYAVNVTDPNPDVLNVSLWYNRTGEWELINSTNTTCPCSNQEVNFTQDPGWLAIDATQTRYYKLNVTNHVGGGDETASQAVSVARDDLIIEHSVGNDTIIDRADGTQLLEVRIKDTDRNQYLGSGVNCSFWVTQDGINFVLANSTQTNTSGYCSFNFNPDCSYEEMEQKWKSGALNNSAYKEVNSTNFTIEIWGNITLVIDSPSEGSVFHKNDTIDLNSTTSYDCSDSGATINWKLDSEDIGSGEDTQWQIPMAHSVGSFTVNATANKSYYHTASNYSNIEIWDYSNVSLISPTEGTYNRSLINILCRVTETNTSGILNYPVKFWVNGANVYNGTTNATGYANYTWDAQTSPPGPYILNCTITDNATLYYNATQPESDVNITLMGILNADVELTPSPPGPIDRTTGGDHTTLLQWNITNIRDENDNPVSSTNITVKWKGTWIGNTSAGSYDLPDDHVLGENNDTINIIVEKQYYYPYSNESSDYLIHGVLSATLSNITWYNGTTGNWSVSPDINASIDNFADPHIFGNLVRAEYTIKDKLGNVLVEGTDYQIATAGFWNATPKLAGEKINPYINFTGINNYCGLIEENKTYLVHGKVSWMNLTWQAFYNTSDKVNLTSYIDRFFPNTHGGYCVKLTDMKVYDNKNNLIPFSNLSYSRPKAPHYMCAIDGPYSGDWDASDNNVGDIITPVAIARSKLTEGTCSSQDCLWHLETNESIDLKVHGSLGIEFWEQSSNYVYRTDCNSPSNVSLEIRLKDDKGNLIEGFNLSHLIFYTPAGTCVKGEEGGGVYNCSYNPNNTIIPGAYTWKARAMGGEDFGWDITDWHGSGNLTDQSLEIRGCLNVNITTPFKSQEFNRSQIIYTKANITDENNQTISSGTISTRIDKNGTGYVYPATIFNSSSQLWESNYTIANSDKEGIWSIRVNASESHYDYDEDTVQIDIWRTLSIALTRSLTEIHRNDSFVPYNTTLFAHVTDEAGNVSGLMVNFYEQEEGLIGSTQTNTTGYANITYNPTDTHSLGNFTLKANVTADHSFAAEDQNWLIIKGVLIVSLDQPSGQTYRAGTDSIIFRWNLTDDNSTVVDDASN